MRSLFSKAVSFFVARPFAAHALLLAVLLLSRRKHLFSVALIFREHPAFRPALSVHALPVSCLFPQ